MLVITVRDITAFQIVTKCQPSREWWLSSGGKGEALSCKVANVKLYFEVGSTIVFHLTFLALLVSALNQLCEFSIIPIIICCYLYLFVLTG